MILFLTLFLFCPPPVQATQSRSSRDTITVGNGSFEATFNTDYELVSMTDAGQSVTYDFAPGHSPLWRVLLLDASPGDSVGVEDLTDVFPWTVSAVRDTMRRPTADGQLLTFFWNSAEFAPGETLDIELDVLVPWDASETRWNARVTNRSDSFSIFAMDYPAVGIEPLGGDGGADDLLLVPIGPGSLFENPIESCYLGTGGIEREVDANGGGTNNAPGFWFAQIAYLYDSTSLDGLMFTTEDTSGFYRKSVFMGIETDQFIQHYVRHYPDDNATPAADYVIPYPTIIRSTKGDWMDVAKQYREWATTQSWCTEDGGVSDAVAALAGAIKLDVAACAGGSVDTAYARVTEQIDYFGEECEFLAHLRGWNWGNYLATGSWNSQYGELAERLIGDGIRVAPYTATRAWRPSEWPGPHGEEFVARNLNGREYYSDSFDYYVMCPGAGWRDYCPDAVGALISGGVASDLYLDEYPAQVKCYSPDHDHPHGGGSYWTEGYRHMFSRIRTENPGAFTMNESRFEMLASVVDAGFCPYWESGPSQNAGPFSVAGSMPVPLAACLYHDHMAQIGGASAYWDTYPSTLTYNFQQAYSFTNGAKLIASIDSVAIARYADVYPDRDEAWSFLATMSSYHDMSPEHLGRGEWLRPPDSVFAEIDVPFAWDPPLPPSLTFQGVLTGAFRATDGTVALVFTNFTDGALSGTFSFNLDACGISGPDYMVERWRPGLGPVLRSTVSGAVYSDTLMIGAHDVAYLRIADSATTGIEGMDTPAATNFQLTRAFPTPSSGNVSFRYRSSTEATLTFGIYDVAGRLVTERAITVPAGEGTLNWDCTNSDGVRVASGIYFAKAVTRDRIARAKVVVLR